MEPPPPPLPDPPLPAVMLIDPPFAPVTVPLPAVIDKAGAVPVTPRFGVETVNALGVPVPALSGPIVQMLLAHVTPNRS